MVRPGYGTAGVASVLAVFLALCSSRGVQAFVTPLAPSRGSSAARSWQGRDGVVGNGGVRARTLRGLEVAAGGSAVESSSVAEDDGVRAGQIEAFTSKVCVCSVCPFHTRVRKACIHKFRRGVCRLGHMPAAISSSNTGVCC